MLTNAPTLAIVAVHTAENEPLKNLKLISFIHSVASLGATHDERLRPPDHARGAADAKVRQDGQENRGGESADFVRERLRACALREAGFYVCSNPKLERIFF